MDIACVEAEEAIRALSFFPNEEILRRRNVVEHLIKMLKKIEERIKERD